MGNVIPEEKFYYEYEDFSKFLDKRMNVCPKREHGVKTNLPYLFQCEEYFNLLPFREEITPKGVDEEIRKFLTNRVPEFVVHSSKLTLDGKISDIKYATRKDMVEGLKERNHTQVLLCLQYLHSKFEENNQNDIALEICVLLIKYLTVVTREIREFEGELEISELNLRTLFFSTWFHMGMLYNSDMKVRKKESLCCLFQSFLYPEKGMLQIVLLEIAKILLQMGKKNEAREYFKGVLKVVEAGKFNDELIYFEAESVFGLALVSLKEGEKKKDETNNLLNRALELYEEIKDNEGIAKSCAYIGLLKEEFIQGSNGMKCLEKALDFCEDVKTEQMIRRLIGNLKTEKRQFEEARKLLKKNLEISEKLELEDESALNELGIGMCYVKEGIKEIIGRNFVRNSMEKLKKIGLEDDYLNARSILKSFKSIVISTNNIRKNY